MNRAFSMGLLLAVLGIALAASVLHARDTAHPLPVPQDRLLYLSSAGIADRLFLSFDALAADVYWIRTIQHYGRDRKSRRTTGRFALLQPLLDLTTSLDPHFNIAYRFGAIFLSMEPPDGPARTADAIHLLEKGLRASPGRWQYAMDIGFIHYWYRADYVEAAQWFERAADMPAAPAWLRPTAALTLAQAGDRHGARQVLGELLASDVPYIQQAAERSLSQLNALDLIDQLQGVVERFHSATGQYPTGWVDLIRAGVLRGVPLDPASAPFAYDSATHRVTLSPQSRLLPLPPALLAK